MDFDELLAEADAFFAEIPAEEVEVSLGRRNAMVRFEPLTGPEWRALTVRHPPKVDVLYDMRLGYDLDGVLADYPRVTVTVDGETVEMITPGPDGKPVNRFGRFVEKVRNGGQRDMAMTIYFLNDADPRKELERAGKASAGAPRKKRS